MPLLLLVPLLAGGAGFALGSWTSSIVGKVVIIGAVGAVGYHVVKNAS